MGFLQHFELERPSDCEISRWSEYPKDQPISLWTTKEKNSASRDIFAEVLFSLTVVKKNIFDIKVLLSYR